MWWGADMAAHQPEPALAAGLAASDGLLRECHDVLLVDLDGVAYLGDQPIAGAAKALTEARAAGARPVFVTNNAARPPVAVAHQLTKMGVAAESHEVMTSAVAAAQELASRFAAGSPVLVVGGAGVIEALQEAGLRPVDQAAADPVAVVQGFAPEVGWGALAEAMVAMRAGAVWIATNTDVTLPSPRGPLPGNGSLVAALVAATGQQPEVIGKPSLPLYRAALALGGGTRPLMIGDRLDTDIAGARAARMPALLVFTGVSSPADLLMAEPGLRPCFIGRDLRALGLHHPAVEVDGLTARCGATRVRLTDELVTVTNEDAANPHEPGTTAPATVDGLDGLRALVALGWTDDDLAGGDQRRVAAYRTALESLNLDL